MQGQPLREFLTVPALLLPSVPPSDEDLLYSAQLTRAEEKESSHYYSLQQ
jgi:hypothetical protein